MPRRLVRPGGGLLICHRRRSVLRLRDAAFFPALFVRRFTVVLRRAVDLVRLATLARAADFRRFRRLGFAPRPIMSLSLPTVPPKADFALDLMVFAFKAVLRSPAIAGISV